VSYTPAPVPYRGAATDRVLIEPRLRDLGGFSVRRVLPAPFHRMVGPFIFFDHMGPAAFAPGGGIDVRIVHSERTAPEVRAAGHRLHGLQIWVALPRAAEEVPPSFHHHAADTLPEVSGEGLRARVLVGSAFGVTSPVPTASPLSYADLELAAGAVLPLPAEMPERAVYLVEGEVELSGARVAAGRMILLAADDSQLRAVTAARLVFIAGEPLDGPRHIEWNFVSSSRERIEEAKRAWRERRFPLVPGDEQEFIPLPD